MRRTIVAVALFTAALVGRLDAQGPPGQQGGGPPQGPPPGQDPFARFLFPPELVMQHQGEINLQDSQRTALQTAIQQAQSKFVDVQWKLSAEGEKLARLLQGATVDEAQVLEQVDRILGFERDVKRTQMGLLIRIKNTLTPAQQAKLMDVRGGPR
jgi:Spy/CpxP family protein refolding chaperone